MNIQEILHLPEGRRIEFKRELTGKADLCKTIVAFSNDAGGSLFIGIQDDPREVFGVVEADLLSLEETIASLIHDNITPLIQPNISTFNIDGKLILSVQIHSGNTPPYYLNSLGKTKGTFIRIGSSNRVANAEMVIEMERLKRNISFDSEPIPGMSPIDLDLSRFQMLYESIMGGNLDESTLKKLHLTQIHNGEILATNALVLLSDGLHKKDRFPYAKTECARFKGTTSAAFIDQKTHDGNILDQVEQAYEFVLRHINQEASVEGVYTHTSWEYPVDAIREAIRNAIVHRDYSLSGKDVKIAIYDDMVEITSPGQLLPSIDFDQMEARQSDIRNKVIAPVFKHIGLIDQWGNGLKLIHDALENYPNIELRWRETGLQFQLQFIKKVVPAHEQEKPSDDQVATKSRLSNDQAVMVASRLESRLESRLAARVILFLKIEDLGKAGLAKLLGHKTVSGELNKQMKRLLQNGYIERTIPEKPNSRLQKHRLTEKGIELLKILSSEVTG